MDNKVFNLTESNIFNWEDLHNKELKIIVTKSEDGLCVGGYDKKEDKLYILHNDIFNENMYYYNCDLYYGGRIIYNDTVLSHSENGARELFINSITFDIPINECYINVTRISDDNL